MSLVTGNQPDDTPTWIDLGIPDLDRAMEFYCALFGWSSTWAYGDRALHDVPAAGPSRRGVDAEPRPVSSRNDLVTPNPGPARDFYAAVFDFTLDRNEDLPEVDLTTLCRPDGHEVAGILGAPDAPGSAWGTTFEVADTDAVVQRATAAGGSSGEPEDMMYARLATITDPFGVEFSVGARPLESS